MGLSFLISPSPTLRKRGNLITENAPFERDRPLALLCGTSSSENQCVDAAPLPFSQPQPNPRPKRANKGKRKKNLSTICPLAAAMHSPLRSDRALASG